ncbi:MAG: hypothetical protein K2X38_03015 [Gemmataceae bacterium]|nr:hypothetical protein [Gemmataceae bacterium]
MNRLAFAALASLAIVVASSTPALAWKSSKFGIGLNWERQSGNNNFLWGMHRNGQVPEGFGGAPMMPPAEFHGMPPVAPCPNCQAPPHAAMPPSAPIVPAYYHPANYQPQGFTYYGYGYGW